MEENKITYEDIQKANETIKTTDIKGKKYSEVNQRIKAFRMVYPNGTIETEMVGNENGVCIFRANIYNGNKLLATGTAYEKENSTFINKTSYIENCETSAIGRALGMCGFGIDTSVASAEEVQNAIDTQNAQKNPKNVQKASPYDFEPKTEIQSDMDMLMGNPIMESQKQFIKEFYTEDEIKNYIIACHKSKLSDLTYAEADAFLNEYSKRKIQENREKEEIF